MLHLLYVLFQLDEARRYIEDGRVERLRLALLLLDNAAEIQMDRQIEQDLGWEEMKERLRKQVLDIGKTARPVSLQELAEWQPLSQSEKVKIDRLFDEKVRYLIERSSRIDPRLGEPLKYLHRYRNEAYHRAKIRRATIRTAALLLLEINCQILLSLPSGGSYDSGEDYSWIQERFGLRPIDVLLNHGGIEQIVDRFRAGILPTDDAVADALHDHIESRFGDLYVTLDSIVKNTRFGDQEAALRASQYFAEVERGSIKPARSSLEIFQGTHTLGTLAELRRGLPQIKTAPDRFEAFQRFSLFETEIEVIEKCVYALDMELDRMIQLQIDIARGK